MSFHWVLGEKNKKKGIRGKEREKGEEGREKGNREGKRGRGKGKGEEGREKWEE